MDINIGQGSKIGSTAFTQLEGGGAVQPSATPQKKRHLTITELARGLPDAEPSVADLPADTLSRKDELGRIVNLAFTFPTPPMPPFTD